MKSAAVRPRPKMSAADWACGCCAGDSQALYRGAATMTAGPTPDGSYHVSLVLPVTNGDSEAAE